MTLPDLIRRWRRVMLDGRMTGYSALIEAIYDCAIEPDLWEGTLALLCEALGGRAAILSINDTSSDEILISKTTGWTPHWLAERAKHAQEIHRKVKEWLAFHPTMDTPFVASKDIPADYMFRSPYVRECLAPLGVTDVMHLLLSRARSRFSEVVLTRTTDCWASSNEELQLATSILPHLRKSVTISQILDAKALANQLLVNSLDAQSAGIYLVAADRDILHANKSGVEMLAAKRVVRQDQNRLRAVLQTAQRELQQAIAGSCKNQTDHNGSSSSIRLSDINQPPVFAHVLPLRGPQRGKLDREAVAAVFVTKQLSESSLAAAIGRLYSLTPAEVRVAREILMGRTPDTAAKILGVAPTTIRTHLDNIFAKTDTSRQADLIRMAMQMQHVQSGHQ